jgi:predicted Ser/Thr protein kinase
VPTIWRHNEWRTAILRKNTVSGEIECQTDLVAPHCMDCNVLRVLELCPVYINVLDLIEVKRLKDRVSRVALLQEPTNIPIFMIMKMASFPRDVCAMQREVEVYAHLFATAANNLAPDFLGYVYEEHQDRVVGFLMEDFEGRWASADDLEECFDIVTDLHNVGVTHGDLRPSNFIVHEDFGVRLVDFESAVIYRTGNAFVDQEALQEKKDDEIRQIETLLLGSPGPSVS